ncbi:MoaD/ThiS family protein [Lysobacter sp. D1-1-M9]|uniref:MoaD/ThiS family protein n=1 Tax=Novilysobacter longmucuonensis TaxID=3098603 RepID=UPI002FC6D19C
MDSAATDTVTVLYFASLRDAAGVASESLPAQGELRGLYAALRGRHGFALPIERLRVAVDGAFARWDDPVRAGSEVAFIPPVSGG